MRNSYISAMEKQIAIRPQDVVVLLKVTSLEKSGKTWMKKDLAESLNLANSEITNVFARLKYTGLILPGANRVQRLTFYEYLVYGLKATFPPFVGAQTRGLVTASGAMPESNISGSDYVWPNAKGKTRGTSIIPLYSEIVYACEIDNNLYLALSACEILRVGRVREVNFARQWLKKFLTEGGD
jgi:hypothetical protein